MTFSFRSPLLGLKYRDLIKDLAKRPLIEILSRRSCQETSYRVLVQRSCQETSFGDFVQRPGEESRGLAQRSFLDSLDKDLTLRSLTQIFCGDVLQTPCTDSVTQGSCTAASTDNLSTRSCARSSTEILTKGTCSILLGSFSFHY